MQDRACDLLRLGHALQRVHVLDKGSHFRRGEHDPPHRRVGAAGQHGIGTHALGAIFGSDHLDEADHARLAGRVGAHPRESENGRAHAEIQSIMRITYAIFCMTKKTKYAKTMLVRRTNTLLTYTPKCKH